MIHSLSRPNESTVAQKGGNIARRPYPIARRLDKPRLQIRRKLIRGYIALYTTPKGNRIIVKTLELPPESRKFKVPGGLRKFKRVSYKEALVEVLIVAKATKKSTKKKNTEVTDDELDELETVDDLEEELEDEDVEEDEDDDEEEDDDEDEDDEDEEEPDDEDEDEDEEDEEPPKKKKKGAKKERQSRAAKDGLVGTQEIAKEAGVDARTLRMVLRKHAVPKDEETGRYQWKSLKDPTVKKILKWIKAGEADAIKKESLDKLKEKKAAEKEAKSKDAGAKKKKKKTTS